MRSCFSVLLAGCMGAVLLFSPSWNTSASAPEARLDRLPFSILEVTAEAFPDPGAIVVTASIAGSPSDAVLAGGEYAITAYLDDPRPEARRLWTRQGTGPGMFENLVLNAEELPPDEYEIRVELTSSGSGRALASTATRVEWPGRSEPFSDIRIRNNFVWDLVHIEAGEGVPIRGAYTFQLPYDRWVFIRSTSERSGEGPVRLRLESGGDEIDLHKHAPDGPAVLESMRELKAGEHVLMVDVENGGRLQRLEVRAVPEIQHSRYPIIRAHPHVNYSDWSWVKKHVLPHVNTIITSGNPDRIIDEVREWKKIGGKWIVYSSRPGLHGWPEIEESAEKIYRLYKGEKDWGWRTPTGYAHPLMSGVLVDEFYREEDERVYPMYTEAIRMLNENPAHEGKSFYPYAAGQFGRCANSQAFMLECMKGGGQMAWEAYIHARPSRHEALNTMRRYPSARILSLAQHIPGLVPKTTWVFGSFSYPRPYADGYASVNYHAYLDKQFHMIATHPGLFGLGGVHTWHSGYMDEELIRLFSAMYRHYCIEGNTERFLSDPYLLTHIRNPDFTDGLEGWTVEAHAEGRVRPESMPGFGRMMVRFYEGPDTFLVTRRSATRPNIISQTITGLEPGRLYSAKMITGDYDALHTHTTDESEHPVVLTVENAEALEGPLYRYRMPFPNMMPWVRTERMGFTGENPYILNYHWQVFRATSDTATLRIRDWAAAEEPGRPEVEQMLITFVEVKPFFDVDESEASTDVTTPEADALVIPRRTDPHPEPEGDTGWWEQVPGIGLTQSEDVHPPAARDLWQGPDDASAALHLAWDDKSLWLAVLVRDDVHENRQEGSRIWNGDAVQFGLATMDPNLGAFNFQFNAGLALASGQVRTHQWRGPQTGLLEHGVFNVTRDEVALITRYEMRLPFDRLGILDPASGTGLGLSLVIFDDDDGNGQDYWLQLTPGVAGGWDPGRFQRFVLQ